MFALPVLSLTSLPFAFSGATPILSCFFDLMYFQKGFVLFSSSPLVMMLFRNSVSAFRNARLHSFWICLKFDQFPVLHAWLYSRRFFFVSRSN